MFFCEKCQQRNNWPGFVPYSYGPCEVCGTVTHCFDVPSSALPRPPAYEPKHAK